MWSLSNAFTSAFKELDAIPQFRSNGQGGGISRRRIRGVSTPRNRFGGREVRSANVFPSRFHFHNRPHAYLGNNRAGNRKRASPRYKASLKFRFGAVTIIFNKVDFADLNSKEECIRDQQ